MSSRSALEPTDRPVAAVQTQFNESHGQLSPDGRWLAYVSDESGRDEVFGATVRDRLVRQGV